MTERPHTEHHRHAECSEALEELYVFLDGELTDERRLRIRTHIEDCSPCFETFDFEAELRLVISHKCRDQVPPSLRDRIAAALAEVPEPADAPDSAAGGPSPA